MLLFYQIFFNNHFMKLPDIFKKVNLMIKRDKKKIRKKLSCDNYETFLDNPNSKLWRKISFTIFGLIFLSIWLMIFESVWDNAVKYYWYLFFADAIISTLFALEYFYRLSKTSCRSKFVRNWLNIIDLLAFLPFFLEFFFGSLMNLTFLRILRLLRVFRLFKLLKSLAIIEPVAIAVKEHKAEYEIWTVLFIIMLLIA